MENIKKSAVGAATPATETEKENFYTDIIPSDGGKIKMLSVEYLEHHPDNPRKSIGDIEELTDSIKKNGIMQNLTVVPADEELGTFYVLIGNRRFEAAKRAGLEELPCKIVENLTKVEQIGIMLEENMQRSDLTVLEQAQGFQLMLDMGETVQGIAQRTGFSESTVRRRVKINELDSEAVAKAAENFQLTLSDFTELEKIEDVNKRNDLLKKSYSGDSFRSSVGAAVREQERRKGIDRIVARLRELGIKKSNCKQSELWGSKYETVKRWAYNADPEKIDIKNTENIGYGIYYNEVYLLRKTQKIKKKELSPEEKRQRQISQNKKQIDAAKKQMFSEFKDFLKEKFRDTGILKHKDHIDEREIREAWEVMTGFGMADVYRSELLDPLLPKGYHSSDQQEKDAAMYQLSRVPVAYQMAWIFCYYNGGSHTLANFYGSYDKNVGKVFERLYNLLHLWGFRFSEDKEEEFEALLDGTSELYVQEVKK